MVAKFWAPKDYYKISYNILKKAYPNDEVWYVQMLGTPGTSTDGRSSKKQNVDVDGSEEESDSEDE